MLYKKEEAAVVKLPPFGVRTITHPAPHNRIFFGSVPVRELSFPPSLTPLLITVVEEQYEHHWDDEAH